MSEKRGEKWEYRYHILESGARVLEQVNALGADGWEVFEFVREIFGEGCWARRRLRAAAPEPPPDHDHIAMASAVEAWRNSLKRPDLSEEDRVRGALLAYSRSVLAGVMLAEPPPGLSGTERERVIAVLAPFAKLASRAGKYPDSNNLGVSTPLTREMVEAWQDDWDRRESAGEDNHGMSRPGPMNWPSETLALDSITIGDLRAAAALLRDLKEQT